MSPISWRVVETAGGHIVGLTSFGQAIYISPLKWLVIFAPLALVFAISAGRNSMSVTTTRAIFLAFAALIGLSLSTVFVVFTQASIARVFFETAAAFGALSLYGYTTRRSLSAMGSFMVDGPVRADHRQRRQPVPAEQRAAMGAVGRRHRRLRRPDRLGHPGDQGELLSPPTATR